MLDNEPKQRFGVFLFVFLEEYTLTTIIKTWYLIRYISCYGRRMIVPVKQVKTMHELGQYMIQSVSSGTFITLRITKGYKGDRSLYQLFN